MKVLGPLLPQVPASDGALASDGTAPELLLRLRTGRASALGGGLRRRRGAPESMALRNHLYSDPPAWLTWTQNTVRIALREGKVKFVSHKN